MIEIKSIASSSKGNCYHITDGSTPLLIECGIHTKKISEAINFGLSDICGCLISHSHFDHSMSVKDIMVKYGIDCYMSGETAKNLNLSSGHSLKIIEPMKQFQIWSWDILPFKSVHDCEGSLGFILKSNEEKVLFLTDSAYCPYKFNDITHIMIECNYCEDILKENIDNGSIPIALKNRLLFSHMSLETLIKFFKANDLSKVKEIHLMHLSLGNSDKRIVKESVQKATGKPVYICEA